MALPLTALIETNTFRTWFNRTNEIISSLNTEVLAAGINAFGHFVVAAAANSSLNVSGGVLYVNTSVIQTTANVSMTANVTITSAANVVNISAKQLLLQSQNGTIINSFLTANANVTVNGTITALQNVFVTAAVVGITANVTSNGNFTSQEGFLYVRSMLMGSANAMANSAALGNAQYDNYTQADLEGASILNLNPTVNTAFTGITAPVAPTTGGKFLFVQNLSGTKTVTFVSANTSSSAANRFKTASDAPFELLPGAAVVLLYTSAAAQWRIAGGGAAGTMQTLTVAGVALFNGAVTVNAVATFNANATFGNVALHVDAVNNKVGIGHNAPSANLHVVGSTILDTVTVGSTTLLTGVLTGSANASLANATLILDRVAFAATFANTITANGSSQSFVRNFKANTFASDGACSLTGVVSVLGLAGRLVIPVGASKWAT